MDYELSSFLGVEPASSQAVASYELRAMKHGPYYIAHWSGGMCVGNAPATATATATTTCAHRTRRWRKQTHPSVVSMLISLESPLESKNMNML
jgi:hypothetical protein